MKDCKKAMQTAYYTLLNGNLSIGGTNIAVYDKTNIPSDRQYPHVVIGEWTGTDMSDKTSFGSNVTATLKLYDRFEQSQASRAGLYNLCGQVKQIIRTRPSAFNLAEFNVVTTTIDAEASLPKEQTSTHITIGEMIRFRHEVEEL